MSKPDRRFAMKRYLEIALVLLMAALVIGVILLSGCASQEITPDNGAQPGGSTRGEDRGEVPGGFGNRSGTGMGPAFGNMSEEERQQMQSEREQLSVSACEGKTEGAACGLSFSQGAKTSGSCTSQNGTMACVPERSGAWPGGPRNFSAGT
jgi:hypothetical protein